MSQLSTNPESTVAKVKVKTETFEFNGWKIESTKGHIMTKQQEEE